MVKIKLGFTVFGDCFEPKTITDIIQIQPTSTHLKNDRIPNRPKELFFKESAWEYFTDFETCLILDEQLVPFWKQFQPAIPKLSEFIQVQGLNSKLYIVSSISGDEMPGLYFRKGFMQELVLLNGELDIDLYSCRE